jgi:hypothetical protein
MNVNNKYSVYSKQRVEINVNNKYNVYRVLGYEPTMYG